MKMAINSLKFIDQRDCIDGKYSTCCSGRHIKRGNGTGARLFLKFWTRLIIYRHPIRYDASGVRSHRAFVLLFSSFRPRQHGRDFPSGGKDERLLQQSHGQIKRTLLECQILLRLQIRLGKICQSMSCCCCCCCCWCCCCCCCCCC